MNEDLRNVSSQYLRALDVIKVLDALDIKKSLYTDFSTGCWLSFHLMRWFEGRFSSFIIVTAHPCANNMLGLQEGVRPMDQWIPAELASEATMAMIARIIIKIGCRSGR
jgi:glucose-6-phosphate isomerase